MAEKTSPGAVDRLREKLTKLMNDQTNLLNVADTQARDLNDDEKSNLKDIQAQIASTEEEINLRIAALEAQAKFEKPQPSPVSSEIAHAKAEEKRSPITGRDIAATSPTQGFPSLQAWYGAVRAAASNVTDQRLINARAAATSFANESTAEQGGWAMPPEWSKSIVDPVAGQASLLGRMNPIQSSSSTFIVPVDETAPWGSTGVQAAQTAEGSASTVSNLVLQNRTVTLYKATAMVNVSEELASDNPAAVEFVTRSMAGRLNAVVEKWLVNGTGVGQPYGILKAPALVSVDKDSGQTADTITKDNVAKMIGRLIPGSEAGAFLLCSPSARIGIHSLLLAAGGNNGSDLQRGFGPTCLGYPVLTSVECPAIGDAGDCTAVAPAGFLTLVKGGINSMATPYFYFDQGLTTLRAYIRIGQVPLLSAAVAPRVDTATTLSHCVTTAARS